MKVLVTGAAGFIGSHLVARLLRRGDDVVTVDRRPIPPGFGHRLRLDLAERRHLPALARWTAWADVVFHLAARPGVRTTGPRIDELRRRDIVTATRHVLEVTPPDTHLVVASSSSVYGGARWVHGRLRPSRETDALDPRGGYARAKAEMERIARDARGDRLALVRPFTVAGEGQRQDMALARWIDAAITGSPVHVFGDVSRRRDITDIRGVVEGLVGVADRRFCGTVNLGSGQTWTLGEMLEAVFAVVGRAAPVVVEPASEEEVEATLADPTRARRELGVDLATDLVSVVERQALDRLDRLDRGRPIAVGAP